MKSSMRMMTETTEIKLHVVDGDVCINKDIFSEAENHMLLI